MKVIADGNLLSAGEDGVIKLWNSKTGTLLKSFYGHDDFIRVIDITKEG